MNKNIANHTPKSSKKKKYLILGATGIVVILLVFMSIIIRQPKAYPLGDKLEYIGASYSGTLLFFSDSNPSASYYYATDMSVQEVIGYFKKAKLDNDSDFELTHPPTVPIRFSLRTTTTNNPIYIFYYVDGSQQIKDFELKQTNKKHVIIIQDEDYEAAKNAL